MAKQITISMSEAQANATASAIAKAYEAIDSKMAQIDSTMLSVAPLMATLKSTNGWKLLDNLDSDGNSDHKTFTKFAEDYFQKSHSVISETCKVGARFFENGRLINENYSGYGYTQLLRLSPLTDDEIAENEFSPVMSSVEIRKKVKEITAPKLEAKKAEKKESDTNTVNNAALNEAITALGGQPAPEPEPETTENVTNDLTLFSDELPEHIREWFSAMEVKELTIKVRA